MVNVVKASGDIVKFSKDKLRLSLERAGASPQIIDEILIEVDSLLYEEISTKEIYLKAYDILKSKSSHSASKYKLKKSIVELGPSGYPFEKFIARILTFQGFKTSVSVIVEGKCVSHEIDIIGEKEEKNIMVECKFHNRPGIKSDVKVPLYINSRFYDIKDKNNLNDGNFKFDEGWVVTNTRFSEDAIKYGLCSGLKLISWDFPKTGNLREWIALSGFHPITCLQNLKSVEIDFLLDNDIILCRELETNFGILNRLTLEGSRINRLRAELKEVLS